MSKDLKEKFDQKLKETKAMIDAHKKDLNEYLKQTKIKK